MKVIVERRGNVNIRKGDTRRRIAEKAIRYVAESTCCPVHGQYATVEKVGTDLKLKGCCDDLVRSVVERMKD